MYRRPPAGVFDFGFCARGEDEKQSQRRRPEASGTKGEGEKNVAARAPSIGDRAEELRGRRLKPTLLQGVL